MVDFLWLLNKELCLGIFPRILNCSQNCFKDLKKNQSGVRCQMPNFWRDSTGYLHDSRPNYVVFCVVCQVRVPVCGWGSRIYLYKMSAIGREVLEEQFVSRGCHLQMFILFH